MRPVLLLPVVLFACPVVASGQGADWQRILPAGETRCSNGSPYSFFVRRADPTRVLLFLAGGGACWNAATCHTQPTFVAEVGNFDPAGMGGVLDLSRRENPFARHTVVVAPYCTGDLHLGKRDQTYSVPDSSGTAREVRVHHRGQVNAASVLDWMSSNLGSPAQIVVVGTSAGSVPTPFYGELLSRRFSTARVVAIGDGAGIHHFKGAEIPFSNWGLPGAMQAHPGWEGFPADWGTPDIVTTAARSTPGLRLYQVDQAWDQSQGAWAVRIGGTASDLPAMLRDNQRQIARAVPSFRTFTLGGMFHTILSEPGFYSHSANGVRLRDWVSAIVDGTPVESVQCQECWRPEIRFERTHLAIVDSTIRLLSGRARWDSTDVGACPHQPAPWSLRCAFFAAGGSAPAAAAAYEELYYGALDRLGRTIPPTDPSRPFNPIRLVNDRPGTTTRDMVSLLRDVRTRIEAGLERAQ